MSRRHRRERPATPEEQQQMDRFAELARAAIEAPAGERQAAYERMRRAADRICDPGNLSNVPTRELSDAIERLYPDVSAES